MAAVEPAEALRHIWALMGGDPRALACVRLVGSEPALPSSFAVGTIAQSTIAASALAAREIRRAATGDDQPVRVNMRHAAAEFLSERMLRVEGPPPALWDKIAGVYRCGDGRWVRLHTNFPHHRDGVLQILGCGYDRDAVERALAGWQAEAFEGEAMRRGLVVTMMRSPAEWAAHGQGRAVAGLPLLDITRIGDAPPRKLPQGPRPLSGLRVLDLTRVIAGPVAGRTLAAHGADVLAIASPSLPSIPLLVMDTGRGKLSAFLDLKTAAGRNALEALVRDADVFIQGYRPGGLADLGFGPQRLAELSPGIVSVALTAYGHAGPWSSMRGFDSLVQTASGFNHAEAEAAGVDRPKELPAQALDHGTGYLMAAAAMMAVLRQSREGGSWHVRASLAQTGRWLGTLGRLDTGLAAGVMKREDIADLLETSSSGFGAMSAVGHAGHLERTPPFWERPSVPLGAHPAAWPAR